MLVEELIELLKKMPPHSIVVVNSYAQDGLTIHHMVKKIEKNRGLVKIHITTLKK